MRLLVIALAGLFATSCAQQCKSVAANHAAFQARQVPASAAPHLSVVIPQKIVDDAIAAGIRKIAATDVPIPGLGRLADYVDAFRIAPDRMSMVRTANGRFRVAMDLNVKLGGRSLFKMMATQETEPVADAKKGIVELALRPDMIQSIVPSVSADAVPKLTEALLAKVPGALRAIMPTAQIRGIAQGAVQHLTTRAMGVIREKLLSPMGELARFKFEMPDLPLEGLALVSDGKALRIDARTTLPIVAGLSQTAQTARLASAAGDRVEVRFAAQTVVELVNYAINKGSIPGSYDLSGNAGGNVLAALGWAEDERPLKVNLWAPTGICMRAQVAARPLLSIANGKLSVGVENVDMQVLEGPPIVQQAGNWAKNMWTNAASQSEGKAGGAKLSVGKGGSKSFGLAGVDLKKDTLTLGLSVGK